jgi:RNA polymerase sigma-70 factor (ECF subfamily)
VEREELNERLSAISTVWSDLTQLHEGPEGARAAAQDRLYRRYRQAAYRYLLAALRDPHAAEDLTQEFALCLVRGDFHNADQERGRFRYYVKAVLSNLVRRYRQQGRKDALPLPADSPALAGLPTPPEEPDRELDDHLRQDLRLRATKALRAEHAGYAAALHLRVTESDLSSPELAQRLSRELGRPLTAVAARQMVHRARERFAALLVEQAAQTLEHPTVENAIEELRDLGLWDDCEPFLKV